MSMRQYARNILVLFSVALTSGSSGEVDVRTRNDSEQSSEDGARLYDRYFAANLTPSFASHSVEEVPLKLPRGEGTQTRDLTYFVGRDGFKFQKYVDTLRDPSKREFRTIVILENRSGYWLTYPNIRRAIRARASKDPQDDEVKRMSYKVTSLGQFQERGVRCHKIDVTLMKGGQGVTSGQTNGFSNDGRSRNSQDEPNVVRRHQYYLSSINGLPRRVVYFSASGAIVREASYSIYEAIEQPREDDFEVPPDYTLVIPNNEEALKRATIEAEQRSAEVFLKS